MTWNHRGTDIEIGAGGYFTAKKDDVDLRHESLDGIKAKIDAEIASTPKRPVSLAVVGITRGKTKTVQHAKIVAINRTSRELMFSDKNLELNWVLPDTQGNEQLLMDFLRIEATHDELQKQAQNLSLSGSGLTGRGYGRIEAAEYDSYLKALEADYAAKLAKETTNA